MLNCEAYLTKNILPLLQGAAGNLTKAHSLFWLPAANNKVMLVSKYFEADYTLLGPSILLIGFLLVKDPNTFLEPQHNTQCLGVIGCNLIQLGCEEFGRVYGFNAFEKFHCPASVHPVVFVQICTFYHQGKLQSQTGAASTPSSIPVDVGSLGISSEEAKKEDPSSGLELTLGQVWVGNSHKAICILANSVKIYEVKLVKLPKDFPVWLSLGQVITYQQV